MLAPEQLDSLVERIGDEILQRLHTAPPQAAASLESCACDVVSSAPAPAWARSPEKIAAHLSYTLLDAAARERDIARLCAEAREHGLAAVCVQPYWVARALREVSRGVTGARRPKVRAVIGFPHGATLTPAKCAEAETALRVGADELDVVAAVPALVAGDLDAAYDDIRAIVGLAKGRGAAVKVSLEIELLNDEQKVSACAVARLAGADCVKATASLGSAGATPHDIALMHRAVGGELGVEAAGAVRSYEQLKALVAAGATRVASSHSVEILLEARSALARS